MSPIFISGLSTLRDLVNSACFAIFRDIYDSCGYSDSSDGESSLNSLGASQCNFHVRF